MLYRLITFEDHGQDFLKWLINEDNVIVHCEPFQSWLWNGRKVLTETLVVGGNIKFVTNTYPEGIELKYPIKSIETDNTGKYNEFDILKSL